MAAITLLGEAMKAAMLPNNDSGKVLAKSPAGWTIWWIITRVAKA